MIAFYARVSSLDQKTDRQLTSIEGMKVFEDRCCPLTIKNVVLQYGFGGKKEAELVSVPTGSVEGKDAVVMTNVREAIVS